MPSSNQCHLCLNYGGEGVCLAFPDGIPDEIWSGEVDHSQPYKGDNGFRFEPVKLDDDSTE